ncbi:hypothetical protein OGAPHI_002478 [Ogataea philodendri]|uniref:BRCT domain-containing protein n=1 Tax=Ogataea philodendri TaxID=1378263 RepID=A0A9P8PC23_9ASCO|nr:uncharacterized protein OGAPHI_002478 [Ogataea philodendri]KAH3668724.1 hypothetical protein OGAPHI_002478 [Ogataea philodendri]
MSLFEGHRFLIIQSAALSAAKADAIRKHILSAGFDDESAIVTKKDSELIPLSNDKLVNITLIVSNTTDFVEYQLAEELMIPVVREDWVLDSIAANLIETLRPYSPDPKYFLSSVSVCCAASVCQGDQDAVFSAVRSFGGIHTDLLSRRTTHLVAVDLDDEKCQMAAAFNQACEKEAILIVRPEWVFDSIVSKRKLPESPYAVNTRDSAAEPVSSSLFKGQTFFLSEDFNLSSRVLSAIRALVEQNGGTVGMESRANCCLAKYRAGEIYQLALDEKWALGNLNWLFWMVLHQEWIFPGKKLLHYPYPNTPLPEMENVVVSVTHYRGDSRLYLQQLVEIMGGQFTKSLRQYTTTHLVAAKPTGDKYKFAQEWGIKCLNHLWLEESYAKWELQDDSSSRYQVLGDKLPVSQSVGHVSLEVQSQKHAADSQLEDITNSQDVPRKKQKTVPKPYEITAILTGCDKEFSASDLRNLNKVGIKVIEQPNSSLNCIIAPGVLRTEKFLKSLSKSPKHILSPKFLTDVLSILDSHKKIEDFDKSKPKLEKYNISKSIKFKTDPKMKELFLDPGLGAQNITNLLQNSSPDLFESADFYISTTIPGGPDLISSIIKSFGCLTCAVVDKKTKSLPKLVAQARYLLCEAKDTQLQNQFRKLAADDRFRIVEWNWVVMSIFNAQLVDRHIIDEN